jgi:hypothetical protein
VGDNGFATRKFCELTVSVHSVPENPLTIEYRLGTSIWNNGELIPVSTIVNEAHSPRGVVRHVSMINHECCDAEMDVASISLSGKVVSDDKMIMKYARLSARVFEIFQHDFE